jgi:GntR family transcriptional regulator
MTIDRATNVPLHAQVFDALRELLDTGEISPGGRLPTEVVLAQRYGVNRLTVRQALADLARAGLVVARQGVGTFAAPRARPFEIEISAADWSGEQQRGAQAAAERGTVMEETLLDVRAVEAPPAVAEHLGEGQMLWMESVLAVDGVPSFRSQYWAWSTWAPAEVREAATAGFDDRVVRGVVGADMFYAWRTLDAVAAGRRDADVLGVAVGSPLLQRCGLNCDAVGRPLLYLQRDAPPGRMRIKMRNRPPSEPA